MWPQLGMSIRHIKDELKTELLVRLKNQDDPAAVIIMLWILIGLEVKGFQNLKSLQANYRLQLGLVWVNCCLSTGVRLC